MEPVETANEGGDPRLLLLCDHAANRVPPCIGTLGLPQTDMERHIAYDVGARGVTLALAALLDAPAILTTHSRLVIDPNRGEDDPTLVMKLYDGSIIPGNRHAGPEEVERRKALFWRPYHDAIAARLDTLAAEGIRPVLLGIHSMTPQLRGRPPRPWSVAVLYGTDARLARPLIAGLRAAGGFEVGDNEPYRGDLEGDTMDRHGLRRGLLHALIEVRNDLISSPEGERHWAGRLAGPIRSAIAAAGGER